MAEGPRAQGRKGARPLGLRASDEDAPAPGQVLPQVGAMGGDGDAPPPAGAAPHRCCAGAVPGAETQGQEENQGSHALWPQ